MEKQNRKVGKHPDQLTVGEGSDKSDRPASEEEKGGPNTNVVDEKGTNDKEIPDSSEPSTNGKKDKKPPIIPTSGKEDDVMATISFVPMLSRFGIDTIVDKKNGSDYNQSIRTFFNKKIADVMKRAHKAYLEAEVKRLKERNPVEYPLLWFIDTELHKEGVPFYNKCRKEIREQFEEKLRQDKERVTEKLQLESKLRSVRAENAIWRLIDKRICAQY
jgi:hypothetical protein